jgi:hypothetical protein
MEGARYWASSLARAAREAQAIGEVDPEVDPEQLAWELGCLLAGANRSHVSEGDGVGFERARHAIKDRLERVTISSHVSSPDR